MLLLKLEINVVGVSAIFPTRSVLAVQGYSEVEQQTLLKQVPSLSSLLPFNPLQSSGRLLLFDFFLILPRFLVLFPFFFFRFHWICFDASFPATAHPVICEDRQTPSFSESYFHECGRAHWWF